MSLQTPRELFIHELSDTMSAEHIVLKMLGELRSESGNDEVKAAYKHHEQETRGQIENLEAVLSTWAKSRRTPPATPPRV